MQKGEGAGQIEKKNLFEFKAPTREAISAYRDYRKLKGLYKRYKVRGKKRKTQKVQKGGFLPLLGMGLALPILKMLGGGQKGGSNDARSQYKRYSKKGRRWGNFKKGWEKHGVIL